MSAHPNLIHGESNAGGVRLCTPEYKAWTQMILRCTNPRFEHFDRYGGRGIRVCDRWRESYEAFLSDMGRKPSPRHSLDRRDNDGNYDPENCRWATKEQQSRNQRSNRLITFNGRTMIEKDWAREVGLKYGTLRFRIRGLGWSVERALTQPARPLSKCAA